MLLDTEGKLILLIKLLLENLAEMAPENKQE
jgi:hypothetical protein